MPEFNIIDYLIMGWLLLGLLRGTLRGLSGELAGLMGLIIATVVAWYFYHPVGEFFAKTTELSPIQADTMALLVIIVGALIVLALVSALLKQVMELTFRGLFDRFGGGLSGLLRYAAIMAAVLLLIAQFGGPGLRAAVERDSILGSRALDELIPWYEQMVERYPDLPAFSADEPMDEDDRRENRHFFEDF